MSKSVRTRNLATLARTIHNLTEDLAGGNFGDRLTVLGTAISATIVETDLSKEDQLATAREHSENLVKFINVWAERVASEEAKKIPKETRLQRYDRLTSPWKAEGADSARGRS